MKTKCFKCNSNDIIDVNGVLMCNNCGEILNADTKKEITLDIDELATEKSPIKNVKNHVKLDSQKLSKVKINSDDESLLEDYDSEGLLNDDYLENYECDKDNLDIMDNEDLWTYIDDVEGLDEDLQDKDYNDEYEEKYPGLLVIKKNK